MADILTLEKIKNAIGQLEAQDKGSDVANALWDQQQQTLNDFASDNLTLEPAALKEFVRYLELFGTEYGANTDQKVHFTMAGEQVIQKFLGILDDYANAAEIAEEKNGQEMQDAQDAAENNTENTAELNNPVAQNENTNPGRQQQSQSQQQPETKISIEQVEEIKNDLEKMRIRSPYSDKNQYMLDRVAMDVYLDMGLISAVDHKKTDEKTISEVIGKIKDLDEKQASEFSEKFIDKIIDNDELFNMAPPATLANAYTATRDKIKNDKSVDKTTLTARLEKLGARMDGLNADFATNSGYYFADTTNIADVYDGYNKMFDARQPDLDVQEDKEKIKQIGKNKASLEEFIKQYDQQWGMDKLKSDDAPKLAKHWDNLMKRTDSFKVSDKTMSLISKYKFLDADGNVIPQFKDLQGKPSAEYKKGYKLAADSRLGRIIQLARTDVVMQNVSSPNNKITDKKLQSDIEDRIPFKLFEISSADRVGKVAGEEPEKFTDKKFLNNFITGMSKEGGYISDDGYNAALDAQVNQTAGMAGRLKSKLKDNAPMAGALFGKMFKPIEDIDKHKDTRFANNNKIDKRKARIKMFTRILKGFGSAFLVSAAITGIAAAAAATAGISLAMSMAAIGITLGIANGAVQVRKWRKAQKAAGKPAGIKAFLKDKRMMASMGTTALASIAMIFGASGLSQAAMALGAGSMALGGATNAIATYKDAKASGLGTKEALTWSLANAAAVIGGGFAGRGAMGASIDAYNEANPQNHEFQNVQTRTVMEGSGQAMQPFETTTYTPVETPYGLGMLGNYAPETKQEFAQLRDRAGALLDRIEGKPVEKVPEKAPEKAPEKVPEKAPEKVQEEQKQLPAHEETLALPEHIEEKQQQPNVIELPEVTRTKQLELPEIIALPEHAGQKQLPEAPVRKQLPEHIEDVEYEEVKQTPTQQKKTTKKRTLGDDAKDPTNLSEKDKKYRAEYEARQQKDKIQGHKFGRGKVMEITRAQANNLDLWEKQIVDIEQKRQKPGLKKSEADKLWAQQKDIKQKLQTLLNKLGRPNDSVLNAAKADAYHRYDLQNAIEELVSLRQQKEHPGTKNYGGKYQDSELQQKDDALMKRIQELGGMDLLGDKSYLYQPVPYKPDYSKNEKSKAEKEKTELSETKTYAEPIQEKPKTETIETRDTEQLPESPEKNTYTESKKEKFQNGSKKLRDIKQKKLGRKAEILAMMQGRN
ncbi:MAG: hypothetical protein LBL75_02785 [Rickettsiales bacterium]|nr:hypothetical protein [Rickettsiales bacterium]